MFTRKPAVEVEAQPVSTQSAPPRVPPQMPSTATVAREVYRDGIAAAPVQDEGHIVIGKGARIHGTIGDCKCLDVHGILEADVVADVMIVREGGGIKGTVQTDKAEIHGIIEGTLVVHDHLEIHRTGQVSGEVSYRTLAIHAGARLRGNIVCSEPEAEIEPVSQAGNVISMTALFQPAPGSVEGVDIS